jgi:hypothetical protein
MKSVKNSNSLKMQVSECHKITEYYQNKTNATNFWKGIMTNLEDKEVCQKLQSTIDEFFLSKVRIEQNDEEHDNFSSFDKWTLEGLVQMKN